MEGCAKKNCEAVQREADRPPESFSFSPRFAGHDEVPRPYRRQFVVPEFFKIQQCLVCAFGGPNDLVQLDLQCVGLPILRVLNDEHHQERNDGRDRIHHELPRIAESE